MKPESGPTGYVRFLDHLNLRRNTATRWRTARLLIILTLLTITLVPAAATYTSNLDHNQTTLTNPIHATLSKPIAGNQLTLVLLVQFADKSNSTTPSKIAATLAGLNNFYAEDSYGLVSFSTTIDPATDRWYSLPHTMSYYSSGRVSADTQLVTDSLQAAYNAGVQVSGYKYAMIVHAGSDEATTRASTDIHSFTIPGYVFSPSPLDSFQISTSVVSESDPLGVYCHEAGHLLGLPDLYDLTQQIDPVNNFIGYWDIMALGEWNPNNGNPLQPSPGTYPSEHSSWSKIQLGWISNSSIRTVYPGNLTTVVLQNLEEPTTGIQAVRIPIGVNSDGSLSYYLVELRAKLGNYDQYLPFPSDYPGAELLVYKVNDSITPGNGNLRLVSAHPRGDLSAAGFGPCFSPCISNNTFWDSSNFVKIIVTDTNATAYTIVVDRTSSPLLLLQVNTPAPGMIVSIDGASSTSDPSSELRLPVHLGPHEVYVQTEVPVSIGPSSFQVGLSDSFAAWSDGNTANPRWISVDKDTVLTASYRVIVEPSFATAVTAVIILGVIITGITVNGARQRNGQHTPSPMDNRPGNEDGPTLLPGNISPSGDSVRDHDNAQDA
jgi:M6 family metalloprotease-like protein